MEYIADPSWVDSVADPSWVDSKARQFSGSILGCRDKDGDANTGQDGRAILEMRYLHGFPRRSLGRSRVPASIPPKNTAEAFVSEAARPPAAAIVTEKFDPRAKPCQMVRVE